MLFLSHNSRNMGLNFILYNAERTNRSLLYPLKNRDGTGWNAVNLWIFECNKIEFLSAYSAEYPHMLKKRENVYSQD